MKLSLHYDYRLAVDGAEVEFFVETETPLPALVNLDVQAAYDDENGNLQSKDLHFAASPQVLAVPPTDPKMHHRYSVKWTPNLARDPDLSGHQAQVRFTLRWTNPVDGKPASMRSSDWFTIVAIDVTVQPELTRIMLHEFGTATSVPGGGSRTDFDPTVAKAHLATLTVQQRKLLLRSALDYPHGRLVIFITLYARRVGLRMHADWSNPYDSTGTGIVPNATYSVFHVRDEPRSTFTPKSTSPITLVCHTQHFVLNVVNPSTLTWITSNVYDRRRPNQWLDKKTDRPVLFFVAALQPAKFTDGIIWNVFYEARTGAPIMPGNSQHGMINTKGCWMLFRNFNWPLARVDELDRIYRRMARVGKKRAEVATELARFGYDVLPGTEAPGFCDSHEKFMRFDRNWAYNWLHHEIVGIKYFGKEWLKYGNPDNDINTHGDVLSTTFERRLAGQTPRWNQGDESTFAYHDFDSAQLPLDAKLFRANALGFATASAFAPDMKSTLRPVQLAACAWADVYFYKEDGLDAEKLKPDDVREP